ncbi:MAG: chemotaxis protein MotA [Myxococcota bacterium]|jgi:chemotaxis protein MotA
MDIATVGGFATTFGLIVISMLLGGSVTAFLDVPSLLIVVGGTFGTLMIAYPMESVKNAGGVVKNAFFAQLSSPQELIARLVDYASQSRRDGVLALEGALETEPDEFLKKGLSLVVDGQDVDAIQTILETEIDFVKKRHETGSEFWTTAGTFAPALGLIGTLIGLVQMLGSMEDPSSIGPAMAVALLTTFYGALLSNVVFNPLAGKLEMRSGDEVLSKTLALQGIVQIATGANPRIVEQQLFAYLSPAKRESQFD